jgi:hypothetical protein
VPPFGVPEIIEAPQPPDDPATASLFAVVPPTDPNGSRWAAGGVTWVPPAGCGGASRWAPCSGASLPVTDPGAPPLFLPFQAVSGYRCSTLGSPENPGRYSQQATLALERHAVTQAENELWTGTLALANGWGSPFLTDGNAALVAAGAPLPYPLGIGRLLAELRTCMGDRRGVLHMDPAVVAFLVNTGSLHYHPDTGLIRSIFGDDVIAGGGYTGGAAVTNTVYTVTTTGSSGGTFTLTATNPASGDTETTAAINWNAGAGAVATALAALTFIAPTDLTVAGGALPAATTVTFGGDLAGVNVTMTGTSSLTGGALAVTKTTTGGSVADVDLASTWVYATGPLITRAGPVEITPTEMRDVDLRTNTVAVFAERTVLAGFDTCCHLGVQLDLTTSGAGGGDVDGGEP